MKNKMTNATHLEGYVYEHNLELRESGPQSKNPGTKFIMGTVSIATDEKCLNVVPVHFSYVTALTSKGSANRTWDVLKRIMDGAPVVTKNGKDAAMKVRVNSSVGLNEWYADPKDEKPVSNMRNEGGFIHVVTDELAVENQRATFDTDMIITSTSLKEGDGTAENPDKLMVRGYVFDFRKALLPVEFAAIKPAAMDYFMNLGATTATPVFTNVRGRQISQTTTIEKVEPGAFGEPEVRKVKTSNKAFELTWAAPDVYVWDTADTITANEYKEGLANREVALSDLRNCAIANANNKASKATPTNANPLNVVNSAPNTQGNAFGAFGY